MASAAPAAGAGVAERIAALDEDELKRIAEEAVAYAATHAISMVASQTAGEAPLLVHAPLTLLPTALDAASYHRVAGLSSAWNALVDRVSRDEVWLLATLELPARADPWLRKLLDILVELRKEGTAHTQPLRLGVYRSDYMIHVDEAPSVAAAADSVSAADNAVPASAVPVSNGRVLSFTPLQVELNTISASFMGLSTRISRLHRHVLARELHLSREQVEQALPPNDAIGAIVKGMAVAYKQYQLQHSSSKSSVVLMVVQPGESNAVDQRILEYTLFENHSIPLIRRTLAEITAKATINAQDKQLQIDGHTVAIVYFRAGYTPRDYPSQAEFDAIALVERSRAVKCPSLAVHLAGCKKVQQVLAAPGVLERFVPDASEAAALRHTFAGLYALEEDDEATRAVIADAVANPAAYVLKPQREGGGNNLWGEELVEALTRMTPAERAAFILMKKICPRPSRAALLRRGHLLVSDALSELGIYSTFVGDGQTTHHSELAGHLLRTKPVGVDEGGVAAGYSCLSSVLLH